MTQNRKKSGERDDQIIALLNQLGERMIRGEQNRRALEESVNKFDRLFPTLQERAANGGLDFKDINDRLARAEHIERSLRERQDRLEREQKAQAAKLESAASLALKMEEALAQQARLARRLEKITQDRARMLHKLESIEEAVIETREAMNSGALLLSPGQNATGYSDKTYLPADPAKNKQNKTTGAAPWRDKAIYQQVTGVTALLVLLLAGGWAAGSLYLDKSGRTLTEQLTSWQSPSTQTVAENQDKTENTALPAPAETDKADIATDVTPVPDITAMDDAELNAMFENDPDTLAAALNNIEPGVNKPASEKIEKIAKAEQAPATPAAQEITEVKPAAETIPLTQQNEKNPAPASASAPEPDVDSFINAQKDSRALDKRIKHDESLPPVIKEIEQKAFENVPEAQHDLAAIYTAGHGGVTIDYTKAAQWFLEAGINGVANARYNLGVLYHQGMGVEKNLDNAIGWYRAAAKMGHPEAQYNLGIAYIEGIGTDYNPGKAAMYFEQAARSGITEAAYNLGLILENGLLGSPSPREALFWYKKSADGGSPEAKAALDHLAKALDISAAGIDALVKEKDASAPTPAPPVKTDKKAEKKVEKKSTPEKITSTVKKESAAETLEIADSTPASSDILSSDEPAPEEENNSAIVAQIQEQLMRLSLYPGPADGIGGPQTEDAIRAYQRKNGLKMDGQPSQALLVNLLSTDLSEDSATTNQ